MLLTDGNGNLTDRFAYSPYGTMIGRSGSTGIPYAWLGGLGVRDEGNGLYFMLHRFYRSDQKRFPSADPSGIDSFPNLYAYGNGNPAFFADPCGLSAEAVQGVGGNPALAGRLCHISRRFVRRGSSKRSCIASSHHSSKCSLHRNATTGHVDSG